MGFSLDSKILTPNGYVKVTDLNIGDLVETPLGRTKVTAKNDCGNDTAIKVTPGLTVVRIKLFLAKDFTWKLVAPSIKNLFFEVGLIDRKWDEQVDVSSLYRLPGHEENVELSEQPEMQINISLETENRIVIADGFICAAFSKFGSSSEPTKLSKLQVEEYENANY